MVSLWFGESSLFFLVFFSFPNLMDRDPAIQQLWAEMMPYCMHVGWKDARWMHQGWQNAPSVCNMCWNDAYKTLLVTLLCSDSDPVCNSTRVRLSSSDSLSPSDSFSLEQNRNPNFEQTEHILGLILRAILELCVGSCWSYYWTLLGSCFEAICNIILDICLH